MKHKKILIRALLVILCLPSLSACLWRVGSASGTPYPIQADGSADMTGAPFTDIDGLRLRGISLLSTQPIVSLECESNGAFSPLQDSNFGNSSFLLDASKVSNFWSLIASNCDITTEGDHSVIKLALRVRDVYVPIFTQANFQCLLMKMLYEPGPGIITAVTSCLADGRGTSAPTGLNSTVNEINILKILIPQGYVSTITP